MTTIDTHAATTTRPVEPPAMRRWVAVGVMVVLAAVTSACSLLPIPGPAPLRYRDNDIFTAVTKTADVAYGSALDQTNTTVTLKMDIYRPAGDTNTARPVIVWVHGGSFCCGDKNSPEIVDEANLFAKKGYVTASIDYRLASPGCTQPSSSSCIRAIVDAQHDAQAAVRFFRKNASAYGVDPTRIAIGGTSAGAITALIVGYRSDDVGESGNPGYSSAVGAAVSLSGAAIVTSWINAGDAPALLFHGTADPLVPYSWAVATVNAAHSAGLIAELVSWQGEGHVPYVQHRTQIHELTTNFLFRTLDLTNATP